MIYRPSNKGDIPKLLEIQKEVFEEDLQKYQDYDTNPACETWEKMIKSIEVAHHFTIFDRNDNILGAIDIRGNDERMHINKIFIKTECQNSGMGTKAMDFVQKKYTGAKLWTLYTPHLSYRNHYFYEKMGFSKIKEVKVSDRLTLFKYEKYVLQTEV
ncbi:GNAT family N-acetyltransferase [Paenibacillus sp. FSL k6-2145]|uniref:GNAT family N-acetyltransferase n=1 Tax=Paenibacillus TaxID=44249 RepID=UPI00140D61EE|nr:GNAT family N-acetyltransferase [Paenibacillus amylolyticus]